MKHAVHERIAVLPASPIRTTDAMGAVLAAPLRPTVDLPAADTSAMDGFAVRGTAPWRLLPDVLTAGTTPGMSLPSGSAVRIATGAIVPTSTTCVIRLENSRVIDGHLVEIVGPMPADGADIRRRGENWTTADTLAPAGTVVTPAVMSTALSAERAVLTVRGPLDARVVLTGDEIAVEGGLRPGQTRDSLGPILPGVLRMAGFSSTRTAYCSDREFSLHHGLDINTASATFVIGGTGKGAADQLRRVLEELGAEIVFDQLRCRPGGSQLLAVLPGGHIVMGVPGNPLAAVTAILLTGRAIADALCAAATPPVRIGRLASARRGDPSRARVYPAWQSTDQCWHLDNQARTSHLGGLINRPALAVLGASDAPAEWAEIVGLPTF
ncbi:molybdopterin-binding protein [Nocardia sp. 348MFTsu5.1]|uniref:molybdopterin-binding protein n=1 Tax=Nocardia sp. 348MFTsu5.1 TaxID=1172185 RepID=UPI0003658578|nr:molybdopterin-binding protein [Nocardia sp. 348MFTsu5.1]